MTNEQVKGKKKYRTNYRGVRKDSYESATPWGKYILDRARELRIPIETLRSTMGTYYGVFYKALRGQSHKWSINTIDFLRLAAVLRLDPREVISRYYEIGETDIAMANFIVLFDTYQALTVERQSIARAMIQSLWEEQERVGGGGEKNQEEEKRGSPSSSE